jgi:hypothetical protein
MTRYGNVEAGEFLHTVSLKAASSTPIIWYECNEETKLTCMINVLINSILKTK